MQAVEASAHVQAEDIILCEAAQRGLGSPAYDGGRCAEYHEGHGLLFRAVEYEGAKEESAATLRRFCWGCVI